MDECLLCRDLSRNFVRVVHEYIKLRSISESASQGCNRCQLLIDVVARFSGKSQFDEDDDYICFPFIKPEEPQAPIILWWYLGAEMTTVEEFDFDCTYVSQQKAEGKVELYVEMGGYRLS